MSIKRDIYTMLNNYFNKVILQQVINLGKKGKIRLIPEVIGASATDNCNLKCIMCNRQPKSIKPNLSVDQASTLFASLSTAANGGVTIGIPKLLDMTFGEPTLNPHLGLIYAKFKKLFPGAQIHMITNATLSVRGVRRQAYSECDMIGISIDGACKETYERIRQGAKFDSVMKNCRDIVQLKKEQNKPAFIRILFVAMDQNIKELPDIVRLAHALGITNVFVQAVEVRLELMFNFHNQSISLDLEHEKLPEILTEAKKVAADTGVQLTLTPQLENILKGKFFNRPANIYTETVTTSISDQATLKNNEDENFSKNIMFCKYLWIVSPVINVDHEGTFFEIPCCHMPHREKYIRFDIVQRFRNTPILDIFNSEFYWKMREDLLHGNLTSACAGCQYYASVQFSDKEIFSMFKSSIAAICHNRIRFS